MFTAQAIRVGEHIDLRNMPTQDRIATGPLVMRINHRGVAVMLRYGVIVFFDTPSQMRDDFIESIQPYVRRPLKDDETESLRVHVDPHAREGIEGDELTVSDAAVERLQVIGDVLAKSVVLAAYESQVSSVFDRIEPFARELALTGHSGRRLRQLQRHLGEVLLMEHHMIGRVEVADKPEVLWERPDLERLYAILHEEFEIRDRQRALERKLNLVSDTAETVAGLIQSARSLRVEWYIVILIVFEILLWIYEFVR
ncbi:MAG: hypothetical protein Kow00105_18320 [Phycisphaeraceae bacterium]